MRIRRLVAVSLLALGTVVTVPGVAHASGSAGEISECLLEKAEELEAGKIDAVTISTPDHNHAPAAIRAINYGKHVFCQKPLSLTLEENQLCRNAAEKYPKQVFFIGSEVTNIPTSALYADSNNYVSYMSVKSWDSPGRWTTNYSAISQYDPKTDKLDAREPSRLQPLTGKAGGAQLGLLLGWMSGRVPPAPSMDAWIRALMQVRRAGPSDGGDDVVAAMARAVAARCSGVSRWGPGTSSCTASRRPRPSLRAPFPLIARSCSRSKARCRPSVARTTRT